MYRRLKSLPSHRHNQRSRHRHHHSARPTASPTSPPTASPAQAPTATPLTVLPPRIPKNQSRHKSPKHCRQQSSHCGWSAQGKGWWFQPMEHRMRVPKTALEPKIPNSPPPLHLLTAAFLERVRIRQQRLLDANNAAKRHRTKASRPTIPTATTWASWSPRAASKHEPKQADRPTTPTTTWTTTSPRAPHKRLNLS